MYALKTYINRTLYILLNTNYYISLLRGKKSFTKRTTKNNPKKKKTNDLPFGDYAECTFHQFIECNFSYCDEYKYGTWDHSPYISWFYCLLCQCTKYENKRSDKYKFGDF